VSPGRRGGLAAGRLSPIDSIADLIDKAELALDSAAGQNGRTVFPPLPSIYRMVNLRRQGRQGRRARDIESMLNDIYNRRIIELAGNIPRLGRLENPDASATAHSKLCGSTVKVDLKMDGPVVTDFAHDVKACALGQASSSIMASHVVGSTADELRELRETVRRMLKENGSPPHGKWADIALLEPVRDYKARHASTMLTFDAVVDAIGCIEAGAKQPAAAQG
jgi:NifU-like protein involved in Fe-S cluster formation